MHAYHSYQQQTVGFNQGACVSHLHLGKLPFQAGYPGIPPITIHPPQGVPLLGSPGVLDTAHLSLQCC